MQKQIFEWINNLCEVISVMYHHIIFIKLLFMSVIFLNCQGAGGKMFMPVIRSLVENYV